MNDNTRIIKSISVEENVLTVIRLVSAEKIDGNNTNHQEIVWKYTYDKDTGLISELEITKREYEVLQEIASGLSNKEIANKLFLSESTIKTHVSNLLVKLDAKRRTQAIQIAKDFNIL